MRSLRWGLFVLTCALLVAALSTLPSLVQAASRTKVIVVDPRTSQKARVTEGGRVKVDTEARVRGGFLKVSGAVKTRPGGGQVLATGTETRPNAIEGQGVLSNVILDVLPDAPGPVVMTVSTDLGTIVWQGSAFPGDHVSDSFEGGLQFHDALHVEVSGTGSRYFLYGRLRTLPG